MQIMREIVLFYGKIYTAGTNFTRPPVATNLNSIINIITNLPCHSSLSQNDPFYRTQMCLKQSDCQNSRNNFANLLKLTSKLLEQLCKLVQNYQPGSSSLRMAISIVFFGPIFKLLLSISGSRLTCIIIVVVIHTYPSRFPCCVLLALSWNTNENPSTDKLSRAIKYTYPDM